MTIYYYIALIIRTLAIMFRDFTKYVPIRAILKGAYIGVSIFTSICVFVICVLLLTGQCINDKAIAVLLYALLNIVVWVGIWFHKALKRAKKELR